MKRVPSVESSVHLPVSASFLYSSTKPPTSSMSKKIVKKKWTIKKTGGVELELDLGFHPHSTLSSPLSLSPHLFLPLSLLALIHPLIHPLHWRLWRRVLRFWRNHVLQSTVRCRCQGPRACYKEEQWEESQFQLDSSRKSKIDVEQECKATLLIFFKIIFHRWKQRVCGERAL